MIYFLSVTVPGRRSYRLPCLREQFHYKEDTREMQANVRHINEAVLIDYHYEDG